DALVDAVNVDRRRALNLRRPGIDLVGEYIEPIGPGGAGDEEWFAGTEIKVPVLFRKGRGAVNAAEANLDQLFEVRRGRIDAARAEVRNARLSIETAQQRVDFTDEAQDLASEVVDLERQRFAIGGGDVFALLIREGNLAKARKDAVDARFDLQIALVAREAATAELGNP
ncbi:MAG: TolC family protein, partial [Myxococcota bacterium]